MQTTTLSFSNMHNHSGLISRLMHAGVNDVPTDGGFDQYDTPASAWVAVHSGDIVHAGVRLTPTTHHCGVYTYMIKDAQDGLLEHLPEDLLFHDAPVDETIWETSRMFLQSGLSGPDLASVQLELTSSLLNAARDLGASKLIGLVPNTFQRSAQKAGCAFEIAGRSLDVDGVLSQCIEIDMKQNLH